MFPISDIYLGKVILHAEIRFTLLDEMKSFVEKPVHI